MIAIAAVSKNWAIGKDNRLLFSIPEDMKFFRRKTMGNTVIMGRKTLESFPGGKPLPKRTNIVLTTDRCYDAKGAEVVCSVEELQNKVSSADSDTLFVIGGGSIYHALLPFIDTAFITKVDADAEADTWFPNLDESEEWEITETSREMEYEGLKYRFVTYKRKKSESD